MTQIQYGRILHGVKNGQDQAIQTSNLQSIVNKTNENKLTALLSSQINYLADDLAISCTSVTPEYEETNGRITQKIDTIIAKIPNSLITNLLSKIEREALLQRFNQHYNVTGKMLQYQTQNSVDIKTTTQLVIPNIDLGV
jgi:hypothetical protein